MTVASTTRRAGPFAGNGVTTLFPFTFKVFEAEDLEVVLTDPNGNPTTLTLNSDYGVLLNPDQDAAPGGTITYPLDVLDPPMAVGYTLAAVGDLPYAQPTDITNAGRFLPQVIEDALDRVTILTQQLAEIASRTLQSAIGTSVQLIFPAPSAGKFIRWNSAGTGFENAEAGTDSMVLQGLLADSTVGTRGAGMVGFDPTVVYPASTVGLYLKAAADTASLTDATKGAALVGYLPPWTGAVGRSLSSRLQEMVSAADFGLKTTNTGAQNVTAWNAAIAYAIAQGGLTLHIPRGTYDFNSTISIAGANNLRITGDGIDATRLRITSATADFLSSPGTSSYQTIDNLTLTSTVTRTAGYMFTAGAGGGLWKRGLLERVKVTQFFNGIAMLGFEQSTINDAYVVNPNGAGTSLVCGSAGVIQYGANLLLLNSFFRGNDDANPASPPVGLVGVSILDVQAIFAFNTDIGQYINQCMLVAPQTSTFNNYFVQVFFDGTKNGDNVLFANTGTKDRFQFTGCWFNGAGALPGGAVDAAGVNYSNAGTYSDHLYSGCRFVSQQGAAVIATTPTFDVNFTGCNFNNTASATPTFKSAVWCAPATTQTKAAIFNGCQFNASGNATSDLFFNTNSRGNVIAGSRLEKGVSFTAGALFGKCAGNYDPTTDTVASADPLVVSPTKEYLNVTGGVAIGTIPQTYPGHRISLVTAGSLTFSDGATLHLAGNFVTAGGSVLSLICEPAGGGWREMSRTNT